VHVARHRSGDEQTVRVPWGSDELHTEPAQVQDDRVEHVHVGFAGVGAAGADLAQFQGPAEEPARFFVQSTGQLIRPLIQDQVRSLPGGQPVFGREPDRPMAAGPLAFRAEQTPAQVQPHSARVNRDGRGWANGGAFVATSRALGRVERRPTTQPVGEDRRGFGEADRAAILLGACEEGFEHDVTLGFSGAAVSSSHKSCPQ
jgi:hypothetical protein